MNDNIYTSPIVSGPAEIEPQGNCITGNECKTGFGAIVIIGGAVLIGVAVYCPPAVLVLA